MFNIPTVPTSQELLDKAFRKSVRARTGKSPGRTAEKAMILTASNILADNLRAVVRRFPNLDEIDPFYAETIDIVIGTGPSQDVTCFCQLGSDKNPSAVEGCDR